MPAPKTIQEQIDERISNIKAHHECIAKEWEAIEQLKVKLNKVDKKKPLSGIGAFAVARRNAELGR